MCYTHHGAIWVFQLITGSACNYNVGNRCPASLCICV